MKILLISLLCWYSVSGQCGDDCRSDWPLCSRWTNTSTGFVWPDCIERCIELGHDNGCCKEVNSTCKWMPARWNKTRCFCKNYSSDSKSNDTELCLPLKKGNVTESDCCKKVQIQNHGPTTYYLADYNSTACADRCSYTTTGTFDLLYCFYGDGDSNNTASCEVP